MGIAVVLFAARSAAIAAPTNVWEQRHDAGVTNAVGLLAKIDAAGNVIVTGRSALRSYTAKYAAVDGHVVWEKIHDEKPQSLALDSAGNVVFTGVIEKSTNGVWSYVTLVGKYAGSTGVPLWEKRNLQPGARWWGAEVNAADDVVLTGAVSGADGSSDIYMAKLQGIDGEPMWESRYASPNAGHDDSSAITEDAEGNLYVGGASEGKFFIAKFRGADRALMWKQTHENPENSNPGWTSSAGPIVVDKVGDVIAAGTVRQDVLIAKYRGTGGTILWEKVFTPGRYEKIGFQASSLDTQGNVFVANLWISLTGPQGSYQAVRLGKYATADGRTEWETQLGLPHRLNELFGGISLDADGNLVTGLSVEGTSSITPDKALIGKYAGRDGAPIWEVPVENFRPFGFARNSEGKIAITGGQNSDFTTILFQEDLPARLNVTCTKAGMLELKWPSIHQGLQLEVQEGDYGISAAGWTTIPGSTDTNAVTVPIETNGKARFFRLGSPLGKP